MRKEYNETGTLTPAEKLGNWFFDRLWRLFFAIAFSVLFYFMVDWGVDFVNFVQSGGELGTKSFNPAPNVLMTIKVVGIVLLNFLIVHKRI